MGADPTGQCGAEPQRGKDTMTTMETTNRYEQARRGLSILRGEHATVVRDSVSIWVCATAEYDAARTALEARPPVAGDEGEMEAYSDLCMTVEGPVATSVGMDRGDQVERTRLVIESVRAGLLEAHLAERLFGVTVDESGAGGPA